MYDLFIVDCDLLIQNKMTKILQMTYWLSIAAIGYAYFGYPLLLWIVSLFKRDSLKKQEIYPFVSVIIAAHNEEEGIGNKINNTLSLDYPQDKLEIMVASDASTDRTNEIVKGFIKNNRVETQNFASLRLVEFNSHHGKTFVQNEAVKQAKGEILLFSDATTLYEPNLLQKIVRNFADERVGAVGGELIYVNKKRTSVGEGNGLYWQYEKFIKKNESKVTSLIGVSGCCYAVRKELYEPIDSDLISDFVIAQMIYKTGKRVVYEPEAISYEETTSTSQDEFKMRVRVCLRTLHGLVRMRSMLNPLRYGFYAFQLISHKILRYSVPVFMMLLLLANVLLYNFTMWPFYEISLYLLLAFCVCALLGWLTRRRKHLPLFYVPFYFCVTNFALLVGIVQFLQGKKMVVWKPLRENSV